MKSIVISANESGSGKTTVTLGLLKAIKMRGYSVQSYKVGPDYIDPDFHEFITNKPSRNLDLYLMGEAGVKASFKRGSNSDIGIVEGVMGLYDGKGISTEYSTAHVARLLKLPIVLVLSPKGKSVTICAEINGMVAFEKANIAAVILNNVSESYYKLLKLEIEKYCNIKVAGYIPKNPELSIKSRHLGLVQSSEIEDLNLKIDSAAKLIEEHVNLDSLLEIAIETQVYEDNFHLENKGLKISVAYDKAFSFYYRENLELLEELGEVTYFSPLKDERVDEAADFIYIGGGYPEVFIEELSKNRSMLKSIYSALNSGTRCYAECGGLMYLTDNIEGHEAVGFFKGNSYMTKSLNNFGYGEIEIVEENNMLSKGLKINCHEFHKSKVALQEQSIYKVTKDSYDGGMKAWNCGYIKKNTLGAYAHVHFFGNMNMLKELLDGRK